MCIIKKFFLLGLIMAGVFVVCGCGPEGPVELAEQISRDSIVLVTEIGNVVFELLSGDSLFIRDLAVERNQAVVIKGRIKRGTKHCCDRVTGHIDIAVFGPDGHLIEALSTWLSPRYIPKHGTKSSRFEVSIFEEVPPGATVRVAYHSTTELEKVGVRLDCGENLALLSDVGEEVEKVETIRVAD
ncbi:MAG: hypothetical protein ACYTFK_07660 [Planctomycetota bacterium]